MSYVFVHGLGQNSSSWNKTISYFDKIEDINKVELANLLNNKPISYDNLLNEFSNYCNNIDGKLNLCGLSLGAVLSLNYALLYPEKVSSLVLVASQYKMPTGLLKFQNLVFKLMPKSFFNSIGISKEEVMKLTKSMMYLDFENKLNSVKCQTKIICGSKDKANLKASRELKEKIAKSNLVVIDGGKHEANISSPKELSEILINFWF